MVYEVLCMSCLFPWCLGNNTIWLADPYLKFWHLKDKKVIEYVLFNTPYLRRKGEWYEKIKKTNKGWCI